MKKKCSRLTTFVVVAAVLACSFSALAYASSAGPINFSIGNIYRDGILNILRTTVKTYDCTATTSGTHKMTAHVHGYSGEYYNHQLRRNRTLWPDVVIATRTYAANGVSNTSTITGVNSTSGQKFHWDAYQYDPLYYNTTYYGTATLIVWP
jgi:hypothetical protein